MMIEYKVDTKGFQNYLIEEHGKSKESFIDYLVDAVENQKLTQGDGSKDPYYIYDMIKLYAKVHRGS